MLRPTAVRKSVAGQERTQGEFWLCVSNDILYFGLSLPILVVCTPVSGLFNIG